MTIRMISVFPLARSDTECQYTYDRTKMHDFPLYLAAHQRELCTHALPDSRALHLRHHRAGPEQSLIVGWPSTRR
eukprot:3010227-Pyramimonas_sp.AAC.1